MTFLFGCTVGWIAACLYVLAIDWLNGRDEARKPERRSLDRWY